MTASLHAQRILEAWDVFNYARFEAELESALIACCSSSACSELESEEQAVLDSAVRQLRNMRLQRDPHDNTYQTQAGFLLLRHLKARQASFPM